MKRLLPLLVLEASFVLLLGISAAAAAEWKVPCDKTPTDSAPGCEAQVKKLLNIEGFECGPQTHTDCGGNAVTRTQFSCSYQTHFKIDSKLTQVLLGAPTQEGLNDPEVFMCGDDAKSTQACMDQMKKSVPLNKGAGDKIGSCSADSITDTTCKVTSSDCAPGSFDASVDVMDPKYFEKAYTCPAGMKRVIYYIAPFALGKPVILYPRKTPISVPSNSYIGVMCKADPNSQAPGSNTPAPGSPAGSLGSENH